jgi:hypothetical protein
VDCCGVLCAGHPLFPFEYACNEAGAQCLAQRLLHGSEAHPLSPIKTVRDTSDGGAASGHSDVTHQALMPHTATAAAASGHAGANLTQPASPDSVVTAPKPAQAAAASPASAPVAYVDDLVPLSPPDESEGPEAAAEYELYLQRWDAGDTLAQRWHRCVSRKLVGSSTSTAPDRHCAL